MFGIDSSMYTMRVQLHTCDLTSKCFLDQKCGTVMAALAAPVPMAS